MKYVDVIIDAKSDHVDTLFTYTSENDEIGEGRKVSIPFSGGKLRGGYVLAVNDLPPEALSGKTVKSIVEENEEESLPSDAVSIAMWMRRRYFCRTFDALRCFAPSGTVSKRGKKRVPKSPEFPAYTRNGETDAPNETFPVPDLTEEQAAAFAEVLPFIAQKKFASFLLHGVTGSGKTELYMRLCAEAMSRGRKAIVLVPEISLTPQMIARFMMRFGEERVATLHSKLSQGERFDEWIRIKEGRADVVIGARSAVFAPFENIGAIIVDEEHETTYKSDMTPKYDTIEVALKRATRHNAVVLLGSATPSVVSNYRAQNGLYRKLQLTKRYNTSQMPEIRIADMRTELANGNRSIYSVLLHSGISKALSDGGQAILFLNRRGYSPFVVCRECGYTFRCPECGLTYTWHKKESRLVCHFCGHSAKLPEQCPDCGGAHLRHFGIGTEKAEELTREAFPDARIVRLDLDTSGGKGSGERILNDFANRKADILIGTQMVAKGLDFTGVRIVGILAADIGLNIADFRSAERTFQLITQAAGRAGRGEERGEVVVQTYSPDHYAIQLATEYNYNKFYDNELLLRRTMEYPPFSDIAQITSLSEDANVAYNGAEAFRKAFLETAGKEAEPYVLGPQPAVIAKLGKDYRWRLYVKMVSHRRGIDAQILGDLRRNFNTARNDFHIIIDVNPFSLI
ncbi:MAG: primosomal protein N' [Clostridiales Family XIII bacterium]|jgi:primosomal protein N' (replication factor Y)|nr:primosomal protein N' [Clostridiales Family XIII bacterium]